MLVFLLILLILFLIWPLLRPVLTRWFQQWMLKRLRRSMGIPDPEKEKRRDSARRKQKTGSDRPIIPKEYAEDVEFREIKTFESETEIEVSDSEVKFKVEEQVSDVEFTEIKTSK